MTEHDPTQQPPERTGRREIDDSELPHGFRVAAAWSWRLIMVGLAVAGLLWVIVQLRIIVVPVLVAILLTALLAPIVRWFERHNMPRWLGVITALIVLITSLYVLIRMIVTHLREGFADLAKRSEQVWFDFLKWLEHNSWGIPVEELKEWGQRVLGVLEQHQSEIWNGALGLATTAGQLVTGTLLALFSLIFLLIDGRRIWIWVVGFLPARAHAPVDAAGLAGWVSVGQYVRVQIFVAFVDAVGIGVGAAILGVPLPIPIAILVFLGSFIPFLGAIATGMLAAFIALVYNGPVNALFMLGVVILVNQIEGHVLQPLVMGSAVRVHPLGVVLAVSAGALLAGIPGALFAVPLAASANAIVNTFVKREWDPGRDPAKEFHHQDEQRHVVKHRARIVARLARKKGDA